MCVVHFTGEVRTLLRWTVAGLIFTSLNGHKRVRECVHTKKADVCVRERREGTTG